MIGVVPSMVDVHVPKPLYPTVSERDWFKIKRWYVQEGDILQPGDLMVEIQCPPGLYDVPTPPQVTSPHRVAKIHLPAGSPTHLGELMISLEPAG